MLKFLEKVGKQCQKVFSALVDRVVVQADISPDETGLFSSTAAAAKGAEDGASDYVNDGVMCESNTLGVVSFKHEKDIKLLSFSKAISVDQNLKPEDVYLVVASQGRQAVEKGGKVKIMLDDLFDLNGKRSPSRSAYPFANSRTSLLMYQLEGGKVSKTGMFIKNNKRGLLS